MKKEDQRGEEIHLGQRAHVLLPVWIFFLYETGPGRSSLTCLCPASICSAMGKGMLWFTNTFPCVLGNVFLKHSSGGWNLEFPLFPNTSPVFPRPAITNHHRPKTTEVYSLTVQEGRCLGQDVKISAGLFPSRGRITGLLSLSFCSCWQSLVFFSVLWLVDISLQSLPPSF